VAAVTLAVVVVVPTAVVAVAVSMAAELEAPMGVVDSVAVVASAAASDLLAEEATPAAAGLKLAAIPVRQEIVRRIFLPLSMTASGIRSATPAVPHVPVPGALRVPVKDAIPEAWRTQASPLAILALPMALGTPLAGQARVRQEASPA
jgi:hypothetical protein